MTVIQCTCSIWLPEAHIAIVDACENFAHEAGTNSLRHGKSGHRIPEEIDSIGQVDVRAQFTDDRCHGRNWAAIGIQWVPPTAFIPQHPTPYPAFFQHI